MVYTCLAQEEEGEGEPSSSSSSNLRFLNYAPGPLETDMATELRTAEALHASLKPHFANRLLDPLDSARVLVNLVLEDSFENGHHVDYYDIAGSS